MLRLIKTVYDVVSSNEELASGDQKVPSPHCAGGVVPIGSPRRSLSGVPERTSYTFAELEEELGEFQAHQQKRRRQKEKETRSNEAYLLRAVEMLHRDAAMVTLDRDSWQGVHGTMNERRKAHTKFTEALVRWNDLRCHILERMSSLGVEQGAEAKEHQPVVYATFCRIANSLAQLNPVFEKLDVPDSVVQVLPFVSLAIYPDPLDASIPSFICWPRAVVEDRPSDFPIEDYIPNLKQDFKDAVRDSFDDGRRLIKGSQFVNYLSLCDALLSGIRIDRLSLIRSLLCLHWCQRTFAGAIAVQATTAVVDAMRQAETAANYDKQSWVGTIASEATAAGGPLHPFVHSHLIAASSQAAPLQWRVLPGEGEGSFSLHASSALEFQSVQDGRETSQTFECRVMVTVPDSNQCGSDDLISRIGDIIFVPTEARLQGGADVSPLHRLWPLEQNLMPARVIACLTDSNHGFEATTALSADMRSQLAELTQNHLQIFCRQVC